MLKSSDVKFLDLSLAILRYMSRHKIIVTEHMADGSFVEFLCVVGGLQHSDTGKLLLKVLRFSRGEKPLV